MKTLTIDYRKYYYYVKPLIPRRLQLIMRRWVAIGKRRKCEGVWPIDRQCGKAPTGWKGWPGNKRFALVLTHDVDTFRGHERCGDLMNLEGELGFRSSFNFVAAEYAVSHELRHHLAGQGFEVGIHGLFHNRKLYESHETFRKHAARINGYLKAWGSVGFRSPCMYHNLEWLGGLDIDYDASTFDTDPFEPQPDGVGTIFPFTVGRKSCRGDYIELPYTLPQDFTLFILFREKDIGIWVEKLKWIAEHDGMALLNTHPDYMRFSGRPGYEEYPAGLYEDFLRYVDETYGGSYWNPLPREMAQFWASCRNRSGDAEQGRVSGRMEGSP